MSQSRCFQCGKPVSGDAFQCPHCKREEPTVAAQRRGKLSELWRHQDQLTGQVNALQILIVSALHKNGQLPQAIELLDGHSNKLKADGQMRYNSAAEEGFDNVLRMLQIMNGQPAKP